MLAGGKLSTMRWEIGMSLPCCPCRSSGSPGLSISKPGTRGRSLAVHLLGSAVFSLAYMLLRAWVGAWQSAAAFRDAFQPLLVKTWHFNLLIYWVMVAVTCAFDFYRKYRDRELRAIELEKRLAPGEAPGAPDAVESPFPV